MEPSLEYYPNAETQEEISRRHTASHVMSYAVKMLYPTVRRGVGPWTKDGFYQDYDLTGEALSANDFKKIEKKMRWIVNKRFLIRQAFYCEEDARSYVGDDPYKNELIDEIVARGEKISFYNFESAEGRVVYSDLCAGPHQETTGDIGVFKLMRLAGAYWRGDENKPQLTRIYGVAFPSEETLNEYERLQEEAKQRDHRLLGKALELFTFDDEVGPGLPLWLPNGAIIVEQLERLAKEMESAQGYQRVRSPHIGKEELYIRSGHLPYYKEDMFPPMELDGTSYYLKAMNCPFHHKIFGSTPKSYRDLPVRYAEHGHCYRYEDSGTLLGLMRTRSLCMNDAHIYCTDEQFPEEFGRVIDLYMTYFKLFNITRYSMRLSKHSPEELGKKYINEPELWLKTEKQVKDVLETMQIPYVEVENEAAFYGPKIDVQIWTALGREFTLATNQLDFAGPGRFELVYRDKDGSSKTPLCIHRAPLSTHERMVGFLTEHYGGVFPLWLAPIQFDILPVLEKHQDYALDLAQQLKEQGGRARVLEARETLAKRVRVSQTSKVPFALIIGDREVESGSVVQRAYGKEEDVTLSQEEFFAWFIQNRWVNLD
jgi:threonyl-tRNA synthetase